MKLTDKAVRETIMMSLVLLASLGAAPSAAPPAFAKA